MIVKDIDILHQISTNVDTVEEAQDIISKLKIELEKHPNGIGLSAIQIGIPKRVAIIKYKDNEFIQLINTKVLEVCDPIIYRSEGCLSFPNKYIPTNRYDEVIIENTRILGELGFITQKEYHYYGVNEDKPEICAIAIQHEIDHMDGITFDSKINEPYRNENKIGRNDLCFCGSGKKYKKCCINKG